MVNYIDMEGLHLYTQEDLLKLVQRRDGETKLGEKVETISSLEALSACAAHFVIVGIPENIGVLANQGIAGTASAWLPALKAILNVQSNHFLRGPEILVLGHFEFTSPVDESLSSLYNKVTEIDDAVYPVIQMIVEAGKVPVVIGGGHNNAYPIIKGLSLARGKAVDVVNIDAHADLRSTDGRHSGNAFSYAIKDAYLRGYGLFGLHENYNNETVLAQIEHNPNISCLYFDELVKTRDRTSLWPDFIKAFDFKMGLEIDLDSIAHNLASAASPSGFSLDEVRRMVLNTKKELAYLHLCEGAALLSDGRKDAFIGKTISYLVTDFIKAQLNR